MFTGTRFPDSCNGTTNPVQQQIVNVLADQGSHQQHKIAAWGYFNWEIGPWQQVKQHKIFDEYRHRQSETVAWKLLTRQTSLLETSASTCKGPMLQQSKELWPVKLGASLVQRWIKMHAAEKRWPYTCLQMPEWEVRRELRLWGRLFRRKKCDDVGCHILRHKSATCAHSRQP